MKQTEKGRKSERRKKIEKANNYLNKALNSIEDAEKLTYKNDSSMDMDNLMLSKARIITAKQYSSLVTR